MLWPVPVVRAGMNGPIGLDAAEIRARIRPGFDTSRVLAIAIAAEAEILKALKPRKDNDHGA